MLCFVLAMSISGLLWEHHGAAIHGVGEVDAPRIDVASPTTGLIVALPRAGFGQWNLYDHVRAGDVIAQFDDRPLLAERNLLQQEIKQLLDEVGRWQVEPAGDADAETKDTIRQAWQYERSRLLSLQSILDQYGSGSSDDAIDAVAAAPASVTENEATTPAALLELRDVRRGLELRWEAWLLRAELLEVRAPISGTLVRVHCWPGQTVHEGGLIATIAGDHGDHIIGYVPEESHIVVEPGMPVTVSARFASTARAKSEVEEVGGQIERIPTRYLLNPTCPQWGLPVRIRIPSEAQLRPGVLVDIVYHKTT